MNFIYVSLGTSGVLVPVLQSIGATGSISAASAAGTGAVGGAVAAAVDEGKNTEKENFCSADCKCRC